MKLLRLLPILALPPAVIATIKSSPIAAGIMQRARAPRPEAKDVIQSPSPEAPVFPGTASEIRPFCPGSALVHRTTFSGDPSGAAKQSYTIVPKGQSLPTETGLKTAAWTEMPGRIPSEVILGDSPRTFDWEALQQDLVPGDIPPSQPSYTPRGEDVLDSVLCIVDTGSLRPKFQEPTSPPQALPPPQQEDIQSSPSE